jgi:hypothetical protein
VAEAFASCGSDRNRSATDARSAGPIKLGSHQYREHIQRVVDRVAAQRPGRGQQRRRTAGSRRKVNASPVNPTRASASTLPGGTSATSTRSAPKPAISAARSNARTISKPEARVGARRSRSNSDTRDPDGTVSNLSSRLPSSVDTRPANRDRRLYSPVPP